MRKTVPQKVDWFGHTQDFLCFALASTGISTEGIRQALSSIGIYLTLSQIQYRIGLAESARKKGQATQRTLYRQGKSTVAQSLVSQIIGNRGLGQQVKHNTTEHLKKVEAKRAKLST